MCCYTYIQNAVILLFLQCPGVIKYWRKKAGEKKSGANFQLQRKKIGDRSQGLRKSVKQCIGMANKVKKKSRVKKVLEY